MQFSMPQWFTLNCIVYLLLFNGQQQNNNNNSILINNSLRMQTNVSKHVIQFKYILFNFSFQRRIYWIFFFHFCLYSNTFHSIHQMNLHRPAYYKLQKKKMEIPQCSMYQVVYDPIVLWKNHRIGICWRMEKKKTLESFGSISIRTNFPSVWWLAGLLLNKNCMFYKQEFLVLQSSLNNNRFISIWILAQFDCSRSYSFARLKLARNVQRICPFNIFHTFTACFIQFFFFLNVRGRTI